MLRFLPSSDFVTSASASLTHKNPQRRKIIHGMRPVERKDRSIDIFVEYPIHVISVAVVVAVV